MARNIAKIAARIAVTLRTLLGLATAAMKRAAAAGIHDAPTFAPCWLKQSGMRSGPHVTKL